MVRIFLGNIKGEKGDVGEQGLKGDKGDTGEVSDINANIIPMSLNDWIVNESYDTTTGEIQNDKGKSRLNRKIPVSKGEVYTLSDDSTYVSQLSSIRWFIYDNGTFIESNTINRGEQTQITMSGNEITLTLIPGSGFSNPARYIENVDNRLVFKLEKGESKTKHLNVLKYYDRKLSHHESSLTGSVDMLITPFSFNSGSLANSYTINTYSENINTEIVSNGEFTLSKGCWLIDTSLRIDKQEENNGYFTLVLYKNGVVSKRVLKSANTHNSISLSTTLFCDEGDKIKLSIFSFGMTASQIDGGFTISDTQGANYLTMKKIGGL